MAKILVIDDNKILLNVITDTLSSEGHDVTSSSNSSKLDSLLNKETYELLITDIIMPDKEGIEIIMHVRDLHPDTKILAISGKDMGGDFNILDLATGIGAHATMKKPFSNGDLIMEVNKLLG
jgi:CheY-like chemotaxis protein